MKSFSINIEEHNYLSKLYILKIFAFKLEISIKSNSKLIKIDVWSIMNSLSVSYDGIKCILELKISEQRDIKLIELNWLF